MRGGEGRSDGGGSQRETVTMTGLITVTDLARSIRTIVSAASVRAGDRARFDSGTESVT